MPKVLSGNFPRAKSVKWRPTNLMISITVELMVNNFSYFHTIISLAYNQLSSLSLESIITTGISGMSFRWSKFSKHHPEKLVFCYSAPFCRRPSMCSPCLATDRFRLVIIKVYFQEFSFTYYFLLPRPE